MTQTSCVGGKANAARKYRLHQDFRNFGSEGADSRQQVHLVGRREIGPISKTRETRPANYCMARGGHSRVHRSYRPIERGSGSAPIEKPPQQGKERKQDRYATGHPVI